MRNKSVGVGVANTSSIVRDVTKFIIVVMMVSKDIRKWSDGRYTLMFDEHTFFVFDNEKEKQMTALQVTKKLNKQQDTIFKLQDLCGKSDGENAKLRIENKRLEKEVNLLRPTNLEQYEQIQKLQKENEKLRRLFEEMKQPITINLTEEDEKELRKLLGLIDDE